MKRRAARTDSNHLSIVEALRKCGCAVFSLAAIGKGVPDLCISKSGHCCLAEIKDGTRSPSKRKLTPDQVRFMAEWKSPVMILSSVDDAVRLAQVMGMT